MHSLVDQRSTALLKVSPLSHSLVCARALLKLKSKFSFSIASFLNEQAEPTRLLHVGYAIDDSSLQFSATGKALRVCCIDIV